MRTVAQRTKPLTRRKLDGIQRRRPVGKSTLKLRNANLTESRLSPSILCTCVTHQQAQTPMAIFCTQYVSSHPLNSIGSLRLAGEWVPHTFTQWTISCICLKTRKSHIIMISASCVRFRSIDVHICAHFTSVLEQVSPDIVLTSSKSDDNFIDTVRDHCMHLKPFIRASFPLTSEC